MNAVWGSISAGPETVIVTPASASPDALSVTRPWIAPVVSDCASAAIGAAPASTAIKIESRDCMCSFRNNE